MKPFVVELYVFGAWNYLSDHNNIDFALPNAETICASRGVDVRVKKNGSIIKTYLAKDFTKKEVRKKHEIKKRNVLSRM